MRTFWVSVASVVSLYAESSLDATHLDFETLLDTEYIPATHIANQISNAASAVSIVTAQDIHDYGYRTLKEILGSMRGLHTFEDYEYTYLGGRGYGVPGDYAGRIVILIDGYRADDAFYGQAYLDEDGILDVSVIERVEYIPGGNSNGYTGSALLGVINIITKKAQTVDGHELGVEYGSHKSGRLHVNYGKAFSNGLNMLASLSAYDSKGHDLTYSGEEGSAVTQDHQNGERNRRLFLKMHDDALAFETAWVWHEKEVPPYPVQGVFDTHSSLQKDTTGFARLKYDGDLTSKLKLSSSLWYGTYRYDIYAPFAFDSDNNDSYRGENRVQWIGGDVKLIGNWFEDHTLSFGMEYRYDYDALWRDNYYILASGAFDVGYSYPYNDRRTFSAYLYDAFHITPTLSLNGGVRYETNDLGYRAFSPQAALIWKMQESTTLKLSAGETNRQATLYEEEGNKVERVQTQEIVLDHRFKDEGRLLFSAYRYHLFEYRIWDYHPAFDTEGVGIEFEKNWYYGARLHASYAWQHSEQEHHQRYNTPFHIAKLNTSIPLFTQKLRLNYEGHYFGERLDIDKKHVGSHLLHNVTLTSKNWISNTDLTLQVKNLTDVDYSDVTWELYNGDTSFPQEGRTFWMTLRYTF